MKLLAEELIVHLSTTELLRAVGFQYGFHSVPSLQQIHMHLISRDFSCPAMKKPVHYLSFQTPFFIHPDHFIESLSTKGLVRFDQDEQLRFCEASSFTCVSCGKQINQFQQLLVHIRQELEKYS
eukprot:TRINITY_DN2008_c0_g3_i3.p1 TRINITY_DN2008_c0_g3~~TRINITY_DN2008_c0_g3_i3.p1  ORF type:complete len:124 (-),score=17.33 TRINITY_DN2008_c0_g3_i3:48-419(-)